MYKWPADIRIRIAIPEGPGVVLGRETERAGVFAEAIQVGVRGKRGRNAEVLLLEHDRLVRRIEQDLLVGLADNLERERRRLVLELKLGASGGNVLGLGTREDRGWNLMMEEGIGMSRESFTNHLLPRASSAPRNGLSHQF